MNPDTELQDAVAAAGIAPEPAAPQAQAQMQMQMQTRVPEADTLFVLAVDAAAEAQARPGRAVLLARLLALADRHRCQGELRQALDLYWDLVEDHPGSAAAEAARSRLLGVAAEYERCDAPHLARAIYERML